MPQSLMDALAKNDLGRTFTGTSSATPGTRSTHAHGLTDSTGNPVAPSRVILQAVSPANDTALAAGWGELSVVEAATDATNIVVKAGAASVTFRAWVM